MIEQFERLSLSSQDYLFSQINDSQIPHNLLDSAEIEKLDCLHLKNFKSFDDKYVGPFLNFTCIIGPNGSGKSNILQAMMFCFCSESSRHSLLDVRELINRQGKQTFKELSKLNKVCSVTVVFILRNGKKFTIKRTLNPQGHESFSVDHQTVSKKVYLNILMRKGINSNSPNYAIWQGQIDRLLLKEPLQLTNLFENLSGSVYFKKPYDEIKERIQSIQKDIEEKSKRITKFKGDRKNIKNMKASSDQYNKWEAQYLQIMNKIYLLRVLEKETTLEQLEKQFQKGKKDEMKKIEEINEMKINAQRDYHAKKEYQKKMDQVMNDLADLHGRIKQVGNPANILKIQQVKEIEGQVKESQQRIEELEVRKEAIAANIPQIPSSKIVEEYLETYEKWEQENSALHRELNKNKSQLLYVEGMIQSKKEIMKDFEDKKVRLADKKEENKTILENLSSDIANLVKSIESYKEQMKKIEREREKGAKEYESKKNEFSELCMNIEELQSLISDQTNDDKEASLMKNLWNVDGFHGPIHQKIKPTASKFQVAFSIIFSTINKYLLCQTESGSRKIGDRLAEMNMMKTVVILDNVYESSNKEFRKTIGNSGILAIDIVDCDKEIKGFQDYLSDFLKGKVLCEDMQAAYRLRDKNLKGLRQIYTLDGNILRPDGTISAHGNPESIKKTYKYMTKKVTTFQDLAKMNKQKIKLEAELKNLSLKFDENEVMRKNLQIDEMEKKKEFLLNKKEQLSKENRDSELKIPANLSNEMHSLSKQREKLSVTLISLEKMIESSTIFDDFMEKHRIKSLQVFRNANNFEYIEKLMKKKQGIVKEMTMIDSELQKLQRKMKEKRKILRAKEEELSKIPHLSEKKDIENEISNKEKQLIEIRNKISKLSNFNKNQLSHFHSDLPALEAKIHYFKQKMVKELQNNSYELGIDFHYPIEREQILDKLEMGRRSRLTESILEGLGEKLEREKGKIEEQLDKHNTLNFLSNLEEDGEKLENVLKHLTEEVEVLLEERKKLTEQLQIISKDRSTILLDFINNLRPILARSYQILTQQEDGLIGTAELHIQNGDLPFEYGIYFSPTPPTKRFVYDLEQLSGGEKSIASLALQYSLALTTKVSFLILDETDAFLDSGNVLRFLRLINSSLERSNIQIIVVTHKQNLFSESQSLLGVTRPKSQNMSEVYSLKL